MKREDYFMNPKSILPVIGEFMNRIFPNFLGQFDPGLQAAIMVDFKYILYHGSRRRSRVLIKQKDMRYN
jgi:hypothetical protein